MFSRSTPILAFMSGCKNPADSSVQEKSRMAFAHARQQGLPRLCEQDAREVGGCDDDEADYGDNDSEASQGPASDPRWAQMSVAAE